MSWFSNLFSGGVEKVVEKVGDTIDDLTLSKEEKQEFKLKLQQIWMQRESEIETTVRKNLEAKERILVAELQQGDSYTKRARPSVVYFGLIMIALNYFLLPVLLLISGHADKLQTCNEISREDRIELVCERETLFPLPQEFWVAWGGIVATWAVGRSFEKSAASNKLSRAVTGSKKQVSLFDDSEAVG